VLLGGGLRRDLSSRVALTIDARWLMGPDSTRVQIDAQPSSVHGTPAGFVESFTNPVVQFSNDPSTGRQSTLSGPPVRDFTLFRGGVQARGLVTIGAVIQF